LAATLCQENPDRNHKLSNFGSPEREEIKWLKEGINGWDVLFTNNQSLGIPPRFLVGLIFLGLMFSV
jgi:hypothetical protein